MTAAREPLSAVVLAGGRSTRFGRDKLGEPLDGRPLLDYALLAVAPLAAEVIVVGDAGPDALPRSVGGTLRRIPDDRPGGGPLAALDTALRSARSTHALVVAGDMPELAGAVLAALAGALGDGAEAAVLVADGHRLPLPAAVDVDAASRAALDALDTGETSLLAMFDRLRVREVPEAAWRALDPDGGSARDVDRQEDLAEMERRPRFRRASCGG